MKQILYFEFIISGCGPLDSVQCISNPCDNSMCPAYPNAVCEVDTCGDCSARYYNNELTEVTDMCGMCICEDML